ncbi:BRCA1-associated protein [Liparis tanakae]|uniref:BRCA1-associated protein n=1 Tax=Liparis tanakae TaxID=230148 RepID=A0A4Z2GNV7_9TELE|nr:BRCA1-associated protein [Liparis tanakae]
MDDEELCHKPEGERKDGAIGELQEQLRDVMFYLEAQQQIEHLPPEARSEIQEGQINIGAGPADGAAAGHASSSSPPFSGRGRRGRGRKRR